MLLGHGCWQFTLLVIIITHIQATITFPNQVALGVAFSMSLSKCVVIAIIMSMWLLLACSLCRPFKLTENIHNISLSILL